MRIFFKYIIICSLCLVFNLVKSQNLPPYLYCVRDGGPNTVVLNWQKPTAFCGTFISYDIYVSNGEKAGPYVLTNSVANVNQTNINLNIPNTDSVFVYMVTVQNCGGIVISTPSDTCDNSKERPPVVPFDKVSVTPAGVEVRWIPSTFPEVTGYLLFSNANNFSTPIATVNGRSSNFYLDASADPNIGPHTYKIRALVDCDTLQGAVSTAPHNTVFIDVDSYSRCDREYKFSWNSYNNHLKGIYRYVFYQKRPTDTGFVPVTSTLDTFATLSTPNDKEDLCVKIDVVFNGGGDKSISNILCFKTDVTPAPVRAFLKRVTVELDNTVRLEYGPDTIGDWKRYFAQRSLTSDNFKQIGTADITGTIIPPPKDYVVLQDINDAKPQDEDYYYRFITIDSCDKEYPTFFARSIHLDGEETKNNTIRLNWNPYEMTTTTNQYFDVSAYYLMRMEGNKVVDSIQLADNVIEYEYPNVFNPNVDTIQEVCFRVAARYTLKNYVGTTYLLFTYSNVTCVKPKPKAFVPNAFTPNGDNLNEFLKPNLVYPMKNAPYEFRVFNRWGQQVYSTENTREGWDGEFEGKQQPTDTYIWFLRFTGADGIEQIRKGVSTLIR